MIGTHADCVIADRSSRVPRVRRRKLRRRPRDAFEPPSATATPFEIAPWIRPAPAGGTGFEARAGLTDYRALGYVAYDARPSPSRARGVRDRRLLRRADARELARRRARADRLARTTGTSTTRRRDHGAAHSSGACSTARTVESRRARHPGFRGGSFTTLRALHDVPGMVDLLGGRERFLAASTRTSTAAPPARQRAGHHYRLYDYSARRRRPGHGAAHHGGALPDGPDGLPERGLRQMSPGSSSAPRLYRDARLGPVRAGQPVFRRRRSVSSLPRRRDPRHQRRGRLRQNVYVQSVDWRDGRGRAVVRMQIS